MEEQEEDEEPPIYIWDPSTPGGVRFADHYASRRSSWVNRILTAEETRRISALRVELEIAISTPPLRILR